MSRIGLGIGSTQNFYNSSINFTPVDLGSSLARHYDASVPSSIRIDVGVDQWSDLSGNNNHLTQSTDANQPVYSGSGQSAKVTLDGSNDHMDATAVNNVTTNFYIVRLSSDNQSISVSSTDGFFSYASLDASSSTTIVNSGTPNLRVNGVAQSPTTRDDVHTLLNTGTVHLEQFMDMDTSLWDDLILGDLSGAGGVWADSGEYYEIVITTGSDSTATRQKIEGYLAHKWGFTSLLDGGHPYKVNPPSR
jgi:hypothetical protein